MATTTILLRRLCKQTLLTDAVRILHKISRPLDFQTYASLLQACIKKKALSEGKLVHLHMREQTGLSAPRKLFLGNALLNMYVKCGSVVDARGVFESMAERDVYSWTMMIAGYSKQDCAQEALLLFNRMQRCGIQPNHFTFSSVLPVCAKLGALEQGVEIHEQIIKSGFQSDVFVENALVDMYAKCGNLDKARDIFDKMSQRRNTVSWTAMITGYARNRHIDEALKLFEKMPDPGVCSWTAMIAAYSKHGLAEEALRMFHRMQKTGIRPNQFTYASVLSACANLAALKEGTEIHEDVIRNGFQSDVFVESGLVDMYAKCYRIEKARYLFNRMRHRDMIPWNAMIAGYVYNGDIEEAVSLFLAMPKKDVASWTTLIAGYAQNGRGAQALELFQQMQGAGVRPDLKTFASVLSACADLAAVEQGMEIHKEIITGGLQIDALSVQNALLYMYAKCGSIEKAWDVFDKMHQRDVVSWNTIIAGYAMHGYGTFSLQLFDQMQNLGIKPNYVTLLGVLSACCHAGLVAEGRQYFYCMSQNYHVIPTMEHYVCMVDLLGRAGYLDEAKELISKMPTKPNATVWRCLLGACRIHSNAGLGEHIAEYLFDLDPTNAAPYVLLSNIYAAAGRWGDTENVRRMMRDRRVKKSPGCSWIEVNKQVYVFLGGDS